MGNLKQFGFPLSVGSLLAVLIILLLMGGFDNIPYKTKSEIRTDEAKKQVMSYYRGITWCDGDSYIEIEAECEKSPDAYTVVISDTIYWVKFEEHTIDAYLRESILLDGKGPEFSLTLYQDSILLSRNGAELRSYYKCSEVEESENPIPVSNINY